MHPRRSRPAPQPAGDSVGEAWCTPLQLTLIVPFLRLGAWIFRVAPPVVSASYLFGLIRANVWHAIATLWTATMHALVAWLLLGCVATGLLYLLLVPLLRRLWLRERTAPEVAA